MGDKAAARRLAASLGVPVLPGYDDPDQSDAALTAAAERIGYPLLVKPSAGGGGKGMRTVRDPAALADALASARREATAAFGDDRLILERLVEGGRHVEIQVLFDAHGNGVHLGERDCSIQRRHQKVLEEAPSPGIDAGLRARLGEAALTLARAVGYVGAGTCEFLVDDRGAPAFLEMNTRLQVEHPVTELVTGRDLVADQLRIAAGEPLGFAQDDVTATGHAIEVRLYAEDAEAGFLPQTGRVEGLRWPTGDGIRVDAGIDARDRGRRPLRPDAGQGHRLGPDARRGARPPDGGARRDRRPRARHEPAVPALAGPPAGRPRRRRADRHARPHLAAGRLGRAGRDPGRRLGRRGRGADRSGRRRRHVDRRVAAQRPGLDPARRRRGRASGAHRPVGLDRRAGRLRGRPRRRRRPCRHRRAGASPFALAPPPSLERTGRGPGAAGAGGTVELLAPMPGSVLAVHVEVGADVEAGDPVVTLEAMKMEHAVVATGPGRVTELLVAPADQVTRGQRLAVIGPAP